MVLINFVHKRSSRALLGLLALCLLLANIECTPVILPEAHFTPHESAQAANFTTELAYFLRSRVVVLLDDIYRQKNKKARTLRWVDQRGGMGNQLQSLAGAVIVAAATGRRLSVVPRNEASVAAWLWGDSGFFEDPLRGWRRQTLRSSSQTSNRVSALPQKEELDSLKWQQQQQRRRHLTNEVSDILNNASINDSTAWNARVVPNNGDPEIGALRQPPLPYPMPSNGQLSPGLEKKYRQQRVKQQQRQQEKREQHRDEQAQRQREQKKRHRHHHDQLQQHLRQYQEPQRRRRRRRLDTTASSSGGIRLMADVLKAHRLGDSPNVATQAATLTVQTHHLDLTNALRRDPRVHQWLFTCLAQPDARRAATAAAAATPVDAGDPIAAATAAATSAERAAVAEVLRRFSFTKVSQLPQLEWPLAHALGALDWTPKPALVEAAAREKYRWGPYKANNARALQVRTCVDCGWIMFEAQVNQTASCDMALLSQTMQPAVDGENLPSVLLPENFLDQTSLQKAAVKSKHNLGGSSVYATVKSESDVDNVQIGIPTLFVRPQGGYTRAQQQRRLLSSSSGIINDSNDDGSGSRTSSTNERSSLMRHLSLLANKMLHGSILSDVMRWTISSSGRVPASVQERPIEKDAILKRENSHAQSTDAVRVNNGIHRGDSANEFGVTAPSRATESGSIVFVTTDSVSAGRSMATVLASQYRVVSTSSLSLSPTLHATATFDGSATDAQFPPSTEHGAANSFKFVHASSIVAEISKSSPSSLKADAPEEIGSSQDELFAARLGPVLDWWLLGEFDQVASCGTTFSLTAIGRRSTIPRSVVLHEHHRPEPLNSVTTAPSRSSKSSRIKQSNRRQFLYWPVNSSTTRSRSRTLDGSPLQSTRSSFETRQRRQLRGKMLVPKSTQTNNRQHSDTRSSSSVANDKDQRAEIVPETPNAFHPDGNIMALFPKSWSGCMSVEVLGRRWLDSRSSFYHATGRSPEVPRQADWLFDRSASKSVGGTSSPPAANTMLATAAAADSLLVRETNDENTDASSHSHNRDKGQRRPSRFKPKKRREPRPRPISEDEIKHGINRSNS